MRKSYAKINWALRITGRRADGFHDLETVFQTISLHDELTFTPAPGLSMTCDDPTIPTDETNLVLRAARAVGAENVAIHLRKRIPAGGGLGGGSSNAAAVLQELGTGEFLGVPRSSSESLGGVSRIPSEELRGTPRNSSLEQVALSLGSDVPFFLLGGTAYATGRGEVLTPMPPLAGIPLLLLLPEERVLTKEAFARVTRLSSPLGIDAYRDFTSFTNDFEEPVFAILPRLASLKARLYDAGATWAGMSGSGSTIVGAFADAASRDRAAEAFPDVRTERCETI